MPALYCDGGQLNRVIQLYSSVDAQIRDDVEQLLSDLVRIDAHG